jgi:hypothetical protein
VVAAVKKVLLLHLVRKMRRNLMVKTWRIQLRNSFRLLGMTLYEVIAFHPFLMRKVMFPCTYMHNHLLEKLEKR